MPRIDLARIRAIANISKAYESNRDFATYLEALHAVFHPVVERTPEAEMLEMLRKIDEKLPELETDFYFNARSIAKVLGVTPTRSDLSRIQKHLSESELIEYKDGGPVGFTKRIANGIKPPPAKK